jgi:hypothetical protein
MPNDSRRPRWPLRMVLVLSGVAAIACTKDRDEGAPEPGTDLYAIAPETVREVVLSTPDRKLYAYRWAPDDTFHIVVATRGSAEAEQCIAGEGFARWLAAASRMPIGKKLDRQVDSASGEWTDLQLRDASQLEPIAVRLHIPSAPGEPAVIQFGADQYSVDADGPMLRSASSGCATLGAKR